MDIGVVGISHKEASAQLRNKVAFTQTKKIDAMVQLMKEKNILEVVILSTCNRSEIYFASMNCEEAAMITRDFFVEYFDVPELKELMYMKTKTDGINHLLRVTTGLDSIIIGEDQILGQVKEAHELAKQLGVSKKILNQTFIKGITFAKKVKTISKISENPLSISSVVARSAKKQFGDLSQINILMIGAGSINQLCLTYLEDLGARNITMCNRTMCTLEEKVIGNDRVTIIPYEDRYKVIGDMDLVICATSSPHLVIRKEKLPKLYKKVTFFDLAMPIDVERKITEDKNVLLLDIDDFNQEKEVNLKVRETLSKEILLLIDEKSKEISKWIHQTKVDPIIASFKDLCQDSQKESMDIIQKRLQLSKKELDFIEKMIASSLNRVIKEPIRQLKQLESDEDITHYKKAIHYLFDL